MKYVKAAALAVVVMFYAGCVTVTPEGQRVRITYSRDVVKQCRLLQTVHVTGTNVGALVNVAASPQATWRYVMAAFRTRPRSLAATLP